MSPDGRWLNTEGGAGWFTLPTAGRQERSQKNETAFEQRIRSRRNHQSTIGEQHRRTGA